MSRNIIKFHLDNWMTTDFSSTLLKLIIALLKHQSEIWLGDEFIGITSKTIIEAGGEKINERLDKFLNNNDDAQQIIKAAQQAEDYFMRKCDDNELRQAFTLSVGSLPSILTAIKDIPSAMDNQTIKGTIRDVLVRDFPNLTSKQQEDGASLFSDALIRAVSSLKEYTLPIVAKTVLDNKLVIEQVLNSQEKMMAVLLRLEQVINKNPKARGYVVPGALPSGSYMPYHRNMIFTGRENEINKIANLLFIESDNKVTNTLVLSGMAGIGKSQLAIEFIFRYGYKFDGIHWVNAANAKSFSDLSSEVIACGRNMFLSQWTEGEEKEKQQISITLHAWKTGGKRLLIFDNVQNANIANDIISQIREGNIQIIVTSRNTDWPNTMPIKNITLREFDVTEGLVFLRQHFQDALIRDDDLDLLAKRLGGLPLALELAARYLARTKMPVVEYINSLTIGHKSLENWRDDLPNPTKHEINIAQTLKLSWLALPDEFTRKVFVTCGFFSPNVPIQFSILVLVLNTKLDAINEAISLLIGYSLIKQDSTMHPLTTEFARKQDDFRDLHSSFLRTIASYCHPESGSDNMHTNPFLAQHALHLLDALVEEANRRKNNQRFGYHVSYLLRYFGHLDQAKLILERLTKKRNSKTYTSSMRSLAWIYRVEGELSKAEEYYQTLLSGIEDEVSEQRASVLHELAFVYRSKSMYEKTIEIENQALELFKKLKNKDGTATVLHELGVIRYRVLGEHEIALSLFETALKLFIETNNKHDEAHVYHEMANIFRAKNDLQTASFYYTKSIEMKSLNGDFRGLAASYHEIGFLYVLMEDYKSSSDYYKKALDIEIAINDLLTKSNTLHDMGYVKEQLGDIQSAKNMYAASIDLKEKLGNLHGKAATLARYGYLLYKNGEKKKGLSMLYDSLKALQSLNIKPDFDKVSKMIQLLRDADPITFDKVSSELS